MKVTLQRYVQNSWLQRHETSPQEIAELLAIADRDIGQRAVSEQEADEMIAFTKKLREQVVTWLHNNHPALCEQG